MYGLQDIDVLMNAWASAHRKRGSSKFIADGAVNPKVYECANPKIAFFLKEAHLQKDDASWNLSEWLNGGAMTRMWGAVAEWTYGIQHTTTTTILPKPQLSHEEKTTLLRSIAVVNVKKSNGSPTSDYLDLLRYAEWDAAFLKKELDILNPDVIVCGNNSSLLRAIYGATVRDGKVLADGLIDAGFMRKNGFAFVDGKIIIDYYHPANQYPAMVNYYAICGLYQQALKSR